MTRAQKAVLPLGIASIIMLISLFFSPKIAGLGLLLWVLTVGWTMNRTMFYHTPISKLVEYNGELVEESWAKRNYIETSIRMLVLPLSIIGLIVVFMSIGMLFLM